MNWNPFEIFRHQSNREPSRERNNAADSGVVIGQLFENSPRVEVIEFASIPSAEKHEKINIEKEKRISSSKMP